MESRAKREASQSNGSVHISRKASVTSSRVPTPSRNASYSTIPSTKNVHFQGKGGSNAASVAATTNQLNRSNFKTSDKSSVYYERSSMQRQYIPEHGQLENNRESMKALSDFLMTREPPSSNWMSASSSEDEKSHHAFKRSAFKIFGRQKKKEPMQPRLIQLPDSAVAAKTRRGARHIAISIPLEHDPVQKQPVQGPVPTEHSFQLKRSISERGAVTVLKPVTEVRESTSSQLTSVKSKDDVQQPHSGVPDVTTPPPPPEAGPVSAGALESYYTNINRRKYSAEGSLTRLDPKRSQRSHVGVSPVQMTRQESSQSDPRLCGGKLYSTASIVTAQIAHSRCASSISAAPSVTEISSLKLKLPTRAASIAARSQSAQTSPQILPQTTLARSSGTGHETVRGHARVDTNVSALSGVESIATTTSSLSPPTVFGMAETARKYSGQGIGGPQIVRSTTPRSSTMCGAHTKSLPKLPGSQAGVITRPRTVPPVQSRNSVVLQMRDIGARGAVSQRQTKDETVVAGQSGQERVKARKQRNIQELRSKSVSSTTNSKQTPFASQEPIPRNSEQTQITPPRAVRCRQSSQERARRRTLNTISPIMLVANLPPFPIPTFANKRSSLAIPKRHASSSRSRTHTPSRSDYSYTSDSNSDLDTIPPPSASPSRRTRPSSLSLSSTLLFTRRRERRAKRNMSLKAKELDDRLSKIEYDNIMLLHTLSGVARSFGDLSRMEKRKRFGTGTVGEGSRDARTGMELTDEEKTLGGLGRMEPVMRELVCLAPRVSEESINRGFGGGESYDEFAEDDGISILG